MTRSIPVTIAAIILALSSLFGLATTIPALLTPGVSSAGPESGVPPFPALVIGLVLNSAGIVAAYGVWKNQKWAKIVSIFVSALGILLSLPGLLFAPNIMLKLIAAVGTAIGVLVIVLLMLRPAPRTAA